MASFEARIADVQRKSAALQENFAAASATTSTSDGGVRVTVGPSGALEDLHLGPSSTRYPPAELAALIMRTAAQARWEAAHKVAAAFASIAEGTEAMAMLERFLPPPPDPVPDVPLDGLAADEAHEEEPQPPRRPAPEAPRRRRGADDDEDEQEPW
jgi:DNA-binding protein YbaB